MIPAASPARFRFLLLVGVAANLIIFPLNHLVSIALNHGDYTPFAVAPQVSALVWDETSFYAAGPSRFFHNLSVPGESDILELRNARNPQPIVHTILLGLLAKALGSLEWAWVVSHALLPTLIWAVLFWHAFRFVRSPVPAMAIAWLTCFVAFSPRNFLLLGEDRFIQPLELTRTPQPALSFLFLLLAVWLFSRALAQPIWLRIACAGVACGVLFYSYYFYWFSFFAGAGLLLVVLALIGRRDYAKTAISVLALGCLVGIPYLRTVAAMRGERQHDLLSRIGVFTRQPDVAGLALAALVGLFLWLYCRLRLRTHGGDDEVFAASALAVVAGASIGLNIHLLTGYDGQHHLHFNNRVIQPLLTYVLLLIAIRFGPWREKYRRSALAAGCIFIAALLGVAVIRQIQVARNTAAYHRMSSPDMNVLVWLRSRIDPDTVVGSSDGALLALIPAVAGTWTFVPAAGGSAASNTEILTRYLMLARLQGRNWPDAETELRSDSGLKLGPSSLSYILILQRPILPETIESARAIWNNLDLARDFRGRRLDYLITRRQESGVVPPSMRGWEPVYQNSKWRVFRTSKQPGAGAA